MSEPATPARPFYVTGGTLKPGEPSYVERRADTELFESLMAGELCYVLTARQMGKSSLMARTAKRLEQAGVASAIVDLTQIGSERVAQAAGQWYFGIANVIHRQLGITVPLRLWWQERADLPPVQRLTDFFRELVLANREGRVVVFVDEIDSTIGLPFADDFFAALRACFNARATEDSFEHLTFVLLGVATPDQLIQDPARTPFNIGRRIDLTDFSPDEAWTLAPGLHADPDEAGRRLEHILYWTGGHPYLSQALCRAVRERAAETGTAEEIVNLQVKGLFLSSQAQREETNLKHVRARLESHGPEGRRLLRLYRRVRQGKPVPDQPTSPLFAQLKLAGVVKATDEGRLAVRNRVYKSVFTSEWANAAMPTDRGRQLAAATLAASIASVLVWYAAFQPRSYEAALRTAIKEDAYNSARQAYTALHANPFSRSRATELMQKFWEQRGLHYAQLGERDESLLSYLQGLTLKDSEKLRRRARNLVGPDYEKLRLTLRQGGFVRAVAFSPDGRTLATNSTESTRLWDTLTGKPIETFPQPFRIVSPAMAFSPDGRTLAMGSGSGVLLRQALTGIPLLQLEYESPVDAIAFSRDGRTFATFSDDGAIRIRETITGRQLLASQVESKLEWYAAAFSPDGRIVATSSADDGSVRIWDAFTGKTFPFTLMAQEVSSMAFSHDGRILVTGSWNGTISLWDAVTGKLLAAPLHQSSKVTAVSLSPDGRTLVTGLTDGTARLWEVIIGQSLEPLFQQESVAATLSADGRTLATGSTDGIVRLWDTVAMTGKPRSFPLPNKVGIVKMVFSPNGRALAAWSSDGTILLLDAVNVKPLVIYHFRESSPNMALAFSPDSRTFAAGKYGSNVHLWNAATGQPIEPQLQGLGGLIALAFSPNRRILVTWSFGDVDLWDASTYKPLSSTSVSMRLWSGDMVFSRDGRTLAIIGNQFEDRIRTPSVSLWDSATIKPLTSPSPIQESPLTVAFNPNGMDFFVATKHWLNSYSWEGRKAVLQNSQLLNEFWTGGFHFPDDCGQCVQAAFAGGGESLHIETLRLEEPIDLPIQGDPGKLLEKWQKRFGLTFDDQMKPVSAMDFQEASPYGGRRSPKFRPRQQR